MHEIRVAETEAQIAACFPVMHSLREQLDEGSFVGRVRRQQSTGYHLAFLSDDDGPVAVAGFRFGENLAWGRFLYVDDLATLPAARSKGYGGKLLRWLTARAEAEGCDQLHLDSGTWRPDAHRFYTREGMKLTSYHFVTRLRPRAANG